MPSLPGVRWVRALAIATVVAVSVVGCGSDSTGGDSTLSDEIDAAPPESFFLGSEFDGLALTAVVPAEQGAGGSTSFIYGDCEPPAGEGGCAPPLEVQNWLECSRPQPDSLAGFDAVKGAPVKRGSPGSGVEVYTGTSTVVLFGHGAVDAVPELRHPGDDEPVSEFEPPAC